MTLPTAYYLPDGDGFLPTELTRGPWSAQHQHGGPPSALLLHALAALRSPDLVPVRCVIDLLRPVPMQRCTLRSETRRAGRNVGEYQAELHVESGLVARLTLLALRPSERALPRIAHPERALPSPGTSTPFVFPFFREAVGYHTSVEVRWARGDFGSGDAAAWMRPLVPLVDGRPLDPVERLLIVLDAANGVGAPLPTERYTFINPDLVMSLARVPFGEWILLDVRSSVDPAGVGRVDTRIADERGELGRGSQSLVVRER